GVIAAKREVRRRRFRQLEIGFNWFWRLDPASELDFWRSLRDKGGKTFARSVDWIGLDFYPGTLTPPTLGPGGERDAVVSALASIRCFARIPRIPASVPIHLEENGWPTQPPARSYARQAELLEGMVRAVHDFRGRYNVSDYRWFNLRDGNTASPLLFQHFGLLDSSYRKKPAFDVYRRLVRRLAARDR
ncbi:MAG TPA: hypothetical protein VEQ61_10430, partial [Thermoleophilaceae bacterium]|nr:hypothetical protein [Thermoleophilaceae bacterium]